MIYILLILIGIILIVLSRESNSKTEKYSENSFENIMKNKNLDTTKYDLELIAIRKDMAESILDLQKEIQEVRNMIIHNHSNEEKTDNNIKIDYKEDDINTDYDEKDIISEINFNNISKSEKRYENEKVGNIKNLIEQGKNDDEICTLLGIGKGEVLLIRGLYK